MPGSALQYTLHCPVACDFLGFVFDERYLLGKKKDDSIVYVFDLLNGQLKDTVFTSNGELHVTPDGQHLVIVDHVTEKSIKIHESGTGNFVSQVIILNYLKVKAEGVYHAGPLSLSNDRMCAIVTTDTSFLCIANVIMPIQRRARMHTHTLFCYIQIIVRTKSLSYGCEQTVS